MQKHLGPTLDYPKSAFISLEQARLNQATQLSLSTPYCYTTYNTQ